MMGGGGSDKKKSANAKVAPEKLQPAQVPQQTNQQQYAFEDEYDDEEDQDSYYTEGEAQTRMKVIGQKSYSAPYIVISDNYVEPLGGEEDDDSENQLPSKAYSTSVLHNLELQEQMLSQMQQDQG
jgi:hypothetical protein